MENDFKMNNIFPSLLLVFMLHLFDGGNVEFAVANSTLENDVNYIHINDLVIGENFHAIYSENNLDINGGNVEFAAANSISENDVNYIHINNLVIGENFHAIYSEKKLDIDEGLDIAEGPGIDEGLDIDGDLDIEKDLTLEDYWNVEDDFQETEKKDVINTLYDARFTLKHQFGYKYQNPRKAITNRTSLRLEMSSHFKTNYLLLMDGKVTSHYSNDHLARASQSSPDVYFTKEFKEMYLQASFNSLSFKIGKQIVKWGESEISVVDKMSPENLEEMYFTDTEDSRIGQFIMECAYFRSGQEIFFFVNPDSKVNKLPTVNSEYYMELPENYPGYIVRKKQSEVPEYGLRLKHHLNSGDLSLIMANLNNNEVLYKFTNIQDNVIFMDKKYGRYQLIALLGNLNFGNILLKGELAFKLNKDYLKTNIWPNDSVVERTAVDVAMDIEYLTSNNITLRSGMSNSYVTNWDDMFAKQENEASFFLGWSKSFLNQTLDVDYLLTYDAATGDIVHNLESEYFIKNDMSLNLDLYYFQPEDGYRFLKDGGRITADISWYF